MSHLIPHTAYAEDQPYSGSILTVHVLHRAFQSGATLGLVYGSVRNLRYTSASKQTTITPTTTTTATSAAPATVSLKLRPSLLATTGRLALISTAAMAASLPFYMHGQTEVQWQDRAWRLLENPGQMEVDEWSVVGTVAGVVGLVVREGGSKGLGVVRVAGAAGAGSMASVLGYMVWRYGVRGGKRAE